MTKKVLKMNLVSTIFLRTAVTVIGLGVLALCVFLLPLIWTDAYKEYPQYGYAVRIIVAAMYITAIPFYVGIYKGWRVLNSIDKNKAFSLRTVKSLRVIAYCAYIISLAYLLCLPFFYIWAQADDAPGLVVIGMFFTGMSLMIGVAIELLAKLLAEAVRIKSENDMTV